MVEKHMAEVEKTLLYVSEARQFAEKARRALEKDGAELHLIRALRECEQVMAEEHKRLMHATYFAVPDAGSGQDTLAV